MKKISPLRRNFSKYNQILILPLQSIYAFYLEIKRFHQWITHYMELYLLEDKEVT